MKKIMTGLLTGLVLLFTGATAQSDTIIIDDKYWGAQPTHSYSARDVIGEDSEFGIDRMELWVKAGYLYVDIFTNYVNNIGELSTELGDLFISTNGWNPFLGDPQADSVDPYNENDPHYRYKQDDWNNGTNWNFALVMDTRPASSNFTDQNPASGDASLYGVQNTHIVESSAPDNYVFRQGQEVQYDTTKQSPLNTTGSWSIYTSTNLLQYSVNMTALGFKDTDRAKNLGFHWTMTCANDVIEGGATITYHTPEPATMVLFGLGLLGLARIGRKKYWIG